MMEIDPSPYIFGSFARRRQIQKTSSSKRWSADQGVQSATHSNAFSKTSVYIHERTKSAPNHIIAEVSSQTTEVVADERKGMTFNGNVDTSAVKTSVSELNAPTSNNSTLTPSVTSQLKCPVCFGYFVDPRVLPCLHTCCLRCLLDLGAEEDIIWENDAKHASGSGGSGYGSDRPNDSGDHWSSPVRNRDITCPICSCVSLLDPEGVNALPPDYTVHHRMILNTLNSRTTKLLCDLCATQITAISRCSECAINVCAECVNSHKMQRSTATHEILILEEARRRGIKKVRKQIMCVSHPENELSTFCSTCSQVLCQDCTTIPGHYQHSLEPITKAATHGTAKVLLALDRARSVAQKSAVVVTQLQSITERIQNHCTKVEREIDVFMRAYSDAVKKHHQELINQVQKVKAKKLADIVAYTLDLQKQLCEAQDVASFADELLRNGESVEVLTFAQLIKNRVEGCVNNGTKSGPTVQELQLSESLQFLPEELVSKSGSCPLYGVVTMEDAAPKYCFVNIDNLKNIKVDRRAFTILETRDCRNKPLQHGGEAVVAEIHYGDGVSARPPPVTVKDLRDGTYRIEFTPDVAGKIVLTVYIKGHLITDGPIPIWVRGLRPHRGCTTAVRSARVAAAKRRQRAVVARAECPAATGAAVTATKATPAGRTGPVAVTCGCSPSARALKQRYDSLHYKCKNIVSHKSFWEIMKIYRLKNCQVNFLYIQ